MDHLNAQADLSARDVEHIIPPNYYHQHAANPSPEPPTSPGEQYATEMTNDISMVDASPDRPTSPAVNSAIAPSSYSQRVNPPNGSLRSGDIASRANYALPEVLMPKEVQPNGAPVRRYFNTKVTGVLLEGMKKLGKEQPDDPLRVLGEFLLQRSKELEGV